jgi:hypothetical protein
MLPNGKDKEKLAIDTLMDTKQWYEKEIDKIKNRFYKIH